LPPENLVNFNYWLGVRVSIEQVIGWMLGTFMLNAAWILALWWGTRRLRTFRRRFRFLGIALAILVTAGLWIASGWALQVLDILHHLILPFTTLTLLTFGETMLLMRATMIEILGDDHVVTARAKGVIESDVRDRHVARLALLPVLTRFTMQMPLVIIGSFVIERIFFWRGMGQALFEAADSYDLPVLMGILSVVGVTMLLAHLSLDVLMAWLDPRLRDAGVHVHRV
jgi:peptide/nickel transport system permease protein